MNEKFTIITPPDDLQVEAKRILLFDLQVDQTNEISIILKSCDINSDIIFYVWKPSNCIDWLFDKILKSDLIIFNAESTEQSLVGYLFSKKNSYYFGNLRSLHKFKKNKILDQIELNNIFLQSLNSI